MKFYCWQLFYEDQNQSVLCRTSIDLSLSKTPRELSVSRLEIYYGLALCLQILNQYPASILGT
jgi:hypothetical protein